MKFDVFDTSIVTRVSANYSLSLGLLKTEHKPSVKKKTVDRAGSIFDLGGGRMIFLPRGPDFFSTALIDGQIFEVKQKVLTKKALM